MKTVFFTLVMVVSVFSISYATNNLTSNVIRDVKIESFKHLIIDGAFDVYLVYGIKEAVSFETTKVGMESVLIDQEGESLFIRTQNQNNLNTEKIIVVITVKTIEYISVKDVNLFEIINPMWINNLNMYVHSHGKVSLNLIGSSLTLLTSGAGNLYIEGSVESADIINYGIGSINVEKSSVEKMTIQQDNYHAIELDQKEAGNIKVNTKSKNLNLLMP
jgi:hypothetical protein